VSESLREFPPYTPAHRALNARESPRYGVRIDGELAWEGGCRLCAKMIADGARQDGKSAQVVNRA
jgi:hypothetical protein